MDRGSFIRSLFVVAAAPKIIGEIDLSPKVFPTTSLFNDLNLLIPEYQTALIAKYGNENYSMIMELFSNQNTSIETTNSYHYETNKK